MGYAEKRMYSRGGARETAGVRKKSEMQVSTDDLRNADLKRGAEEATAGTRLSVKVFCEMDLDSGATASRGVEARKSGHCTGVRCVLQQGIEQKKLGIPIDIWHCAEAGIWATAIPAKK